MDNKIKLFFVMVFWVTHVFAQTQSEAEQMLKKVFTKYSQAAYSNYQLQYNWYENQTSNKITQQYKGVLITNGKNQYQKIHQTEFLNTPEYAVKVYHEEKMVEITKGGQPIQMMHTEAYLKAFTMEAQKISAGKVQFIFHPKNEKLKVEINKILMTVDTNTLQVLSQVVYYAKPMETGIDKQSIPRFEIIFTPRVKDEITESKLFKLSNYFSVPLGTIKLHPRLSKYTLHQS